MKYSIEDYNVLSYLLKENSMSYKQAVTWAYAQFTDQGLVSFIEKLSLASDSAEMIELIGDTYQVYGELGNEFLAGEIAKQYSEEKISLYCAISHILFDLDLALPEEERCKLYIAEDYFGWHDSAEPQALVHVMPLFDKYRPIYEHAVAKFIV